MGPSIVACRLQRWLNIWTIKRYNVHRAKGHYGFKAVSRGLRNSKVPHGISVRDSDIVPEKVRRSYIGRFKPEGSPWVIVRKPGGAMIASKRVS